jgi:uncharacterized protein YciI
MKAVVFYESAADLAALAPVHGPAHRARWQEFSRRGDLLMIGPFANAQEDGAMAIFTSREAAKEFVRGDPFVLAGVVRKWTILDWHEALVPDAPAAGEPGVLPGAGGWAVAAEHLGPVAVPRGGGAVGVADQGPAHPVDHHLMMVKTQQNAVVQAGLAAVALVLKMVHFAGRRGLITAAGPLAVAVPGLDRGADPGRDIVTKANVQGLAGAAEPGAELAAAQEARQPAGTRQQLDGCADDLLLE